MNKQRFSMPTSLVFIICFSLISSPIAHAYDAAYMDHVANSNLSTFPVINQEDENAPKPLQDQTFTDLIYALFSPRKFYIKPLDERTKRETFFKQSCASPEQSEAVIDTSFIGKMELVRGDAHPQDHLAHRLTTHNGIPLCATQIGQKRCVELLTQPTSNINVVKHRQAIIKELVENDALRTQCERILADAKGSEDLLLDLFQYNEMPELEKVLYFQQFFEKFGLNDSPLTLSIATRLSHIMLTMPNFIFALGPIGYKFFVDYLTNDNTLGNILGSGLACVYWPLLLINLSAQKQIFYNQPKNIQEKLIGAATYLNGIKRLIRTFSSNETIAAHMPSLDHIVQSLRSSSEKSPQFKALSKLLTDSAFDKGAPSIFSSQGKILVAYKYMLMESVRREFSDALNMLGEIDLYVALAKKVKAHGNERVHYCFAEFKESDTPYAHAINFWNPFVDSKQVVTNTITFDTNGMQNIVLTGPNTGGKSTFLKGFMIDLLLAQTFGIAPADKVVMTPFTKFACHMNITDDTAGGVSLFKAEVKRAHELMDMVRSLAPHQFAFIIIDEIFTGTSPEQAEDLSHKFATQLSTHKNAQFICATHFKKLTQMEQESHGFCKNYHMGAITNNAGKVLQYTYTLQSGPSPVKNAEQVAIESGAF